MCFDKLDGDSIDSIMSCLGAPSLLQVQLASSWAHEAGRLNHLWMRLCEFDFGVLPPPSGIAADVPGVPLNQC